MKAVIEMNKTATNLGEISADDSKRCRGAINVLIRLLPLIFEDKEFFMRAMWHEQSFFNNQINALVLMDALSVLLFKPGFTIGALEPGVSPQPFGKCRV